MDLIKNIIIKWMLLLHCGARKNLLAKVRKISKQLHWVFYYMNDIEIGFLELTNNRLFFTVLDELLP